MFEDIEILVIPLSLTIIITYVFASFAIHRYKLKYGKGPWIHESSITALLGLIVGGFVKLTTGNSIKFDNNIFFYLVLPPVIFSAGFTLKRRNFFRYMHYISIFGIFGTLINFVLLSGSAYFFCHYVYTGNNEAISSLSLMNSMLLGSVLSASDEVSAMSLVRMKDFPRLGALIFGEGVLNDALSIVIFKALLEKSLIPVTNDSIYDVKEIFKILTNFSHTVFSQVIASCIIGIGVGLVNSRIFKLIPNLRHHPVHQSSLVLLWGYLAYFIAEAFGISGILTLFISAITLAHYSWPSMSKTAQLATKVSFTSMSDLAEAFAFAYVGLSLWNFSTTNFCAIFALYMLVLVILCRFLTIFLLCYILRICNKSLSLPTGEVAALSLGGCVRGCLCWAQVLQIKEMHILVTTTLLIVMTTSLCAGVILPIVMPMLINVPININPVGRYATEFHLFDLENNGKNETPSPRSKDRPYLNTKESTYSAHLDVTIDESPIKSSSINHTSSFNAILYILWIRFDELFMKPLFGGSYTDEIRSYLLEETKEIPTREILNKDNLKHINEIINLDHSLLYHGSQMLDRSGSSSRYKDIDRNRNSSNYTSPVTPIFKANSTNSLSEGRDLDSFINDYDNDINTSNTSNIFNNNEDDEIYEDLFLKNENSLINSQLKSNKSPVKISSFRMNLLSPTLKSSIINNNNNKEFINENTSLLNYNNNSNSNNNSNDNNK